MPEVILKDTQQQAREIDSHSCHYTLCGCTFHTYTKMQATFSQVIISLEITLLFLSWGGVLLYTWQADLQDDLQDICSLLLLCSGSLLYIERETIQVNLIYSREHFIYFLIFICLFIFGCAGSSLLCRLFFSCVEQGIVSSYGAWASHCGGFP